MPDSIRHPEAVGLRTSVTHRLESGIRRHDSPESSTHIAGRRLSARLLYAGTPAIVTDDRERTSRMGSTGQLNAISPWVNPVTRALREGRVCIGAFSVAFGSPAVAQIFGRAGFHWFYMDMEHSRSSYEDIAQMSIAAKNSGIVPIAGPTRSGRPFGRAYARRRSDGRRRAPRRDRRRNGASR